MTRISLKFASEKAGIDIRSARRKLTYLKIYYPALYKKLVRRENNRYKLHFDIVIFFKLDLRKHKNKIDLSDIISKSKSSYLQKKDLENGTEKSIEFTIEKEKNAKREKTGGREKGTPNLITRDIRKILHDFVLDKINNIDHYFNRLTPKEKLNFLEKIFPYVLPKLNPIDKNPDQVPEWQRKINAMSVEELIELSKELDQKNAEIIAQRI